MVECSCSLFAHSSIRLLVSLPPYLLLPGLPVRQGSPSHGIALASRPRVPDVAPVAWNSTVLLLAYLRYCVRLQLCTMYPSVYILCFFFSFLFFLLILFYAGYDWIVMVAFVHRKPI